MKNTLKLVLTRKWYEMILSGEKKEEYREIKPFWNKRLNKKYDSVIFYHGYAKDRPCFEIECKGIEQSLGIIKWGAKPKKVCWIIKLGDVL